MGFSKLPHPAYPRPRPNGAGCQFPLRDALALIVMIGIPARQNLHCTFKHSVFGSKMQQLEDR
ncbi:hypothetical protein, partial [Slackia piriformis]|uniref:hypothetical protein n=1 Tax=Slackia piriformis TaxID=626934 RepID=UPI002F942AAB